MLLFYWHILMQGYKHSLLSLITFRYQRWYWYITNFILPLIFLSQLIYKYYRLLIASEKLSNLFRYWLSLRLHLCCILNNFLCPFIWFIPCLAFYYILFLSLYQNNLRQAYYFKAAFFNYLNLSFSTCVYSFFAHKLCYWFIIFFINKFHVNSWQYLYLKLLQLSANFFLLNAFLI